MICDPTVDAAHFASKIARPDVRLVGGSTDLAAGLNLAAGPFVAKFPKLARVVVVTDGGTSQEPAFRAAAILKDKSVEIQTFGTDDADEDFLNKLATCLSLAVHVPSENLRLAIGSSASLLLGGQ
jgi:hypothetical protein